MSVAVVSDRLKIVSHFPGRLRVRAVPFRDAALGAQVVEGIRAETGVVAASATPLTGSVLVEYEAHRIQMPWLVQRIVRLGGLDGVAVDHDGLPLAPGGPAVREALERVNQTLVQASQGRLDVKTALPGTLAGLGVLTLLFGRRALPQWYDLMFWSFVTFVNLNPPQHGKPDHP